MSSQEKDRRMSAASGAGSASGSGEGTKANTQSIPSIDRDLSSGSNKSKRSARLINSSSGYYHQGSPSHSGLSRHYSKAPVASSKVTVASVKKTIRRIFKCIWNYVKHVFSLSLIRDPISYYRAEDFTPKGERISNINEHENDQTLDMIEAACNYDQATGALFEKIIEERKTSALSKKRMSTTLDISQYPPWNDSMLDRLQCIFQIFDASGDGLVDFEELSNMMVEYGDKSTPEDRRKVFDNADSLKKGALNFFEFVNMIHVLTVKSPDSNPQTVVECFRQIDRNMARIRSLDVVQQLQAGLF